MGQPAAFLNGLTGGIETAMKIKNMKMGIDRQAKQDAAADASAARQSAFEKDVAAIDPMQGVKDRYQSALAEWEANNKSIQPVNAQSDIQNFSTPSIPGVSVPAASGFKNSDIYASPPPNSPVTKAVSAGIPLAPQQQNMQPKPEMGQPTLGDALNYRAQVLDAKRRAGLDVSQDLIDM